MASITVEQRNEITGLIITMFNAAPGAGVLSDVVGAREAGTSLESIADILATKPQFQSVYPSFLTSQEFADRVVGNLLPSDMPSGAKAWATDWIISKINGGESSASVLLQAFQALSTTENSNYESAQALLENRIEVANHYSVVREQPSTSLVELQDVLDGVTADPASVQVAKDHIDQNLAGQNFVLTTGADNFTGSTGDDEFRAMSVDANGAPASTFTSFDNLNGGAGTDTLNLFVDGALNGTIPANVTVQNVEIININSVGAAFAPVDASRFQGATQINQKALASAVTNLAATTTAGFIELAGGLSVTAADAAASAKVNFSNVSDTVTLDVLAGANGTLNAVDITGTVVDVPTDGTVDAIATTITAGKDVESLTVNSAVDIDLTVNNGAGKTVSTVDASGSTGAITYVAAATVANVSTGSAADTVTLATAFSATLNSASLNGGDGNDTLTVAVDDTADVDATVSVDGGAGDDAIDIATAVAPGAATLALNVSGGAGDDTIKLTAGINSITEADAIDGGEGTDTLVADGKALVAEDYILLNEVLTGFEGIEFTNTSATVAADRMAGFKSITFSDAAGTITGVAADQKLFTSVDLTADAAGYKAGGTYAGTLDISAAPATTGSGITVVANADTVNLAIGAGESDGDGAVDDGGAYLKGDAKSANVTLTGTPDGDVEETAAVLLDTTADHTKMESFTVSGNGKAMVINDTAAALVQIDASGLTNAQPDGTIGTGLLLNSTNASAESVKLSQGLDLVYLGDSTFGDMDTVDGLTLTDDPATSDQLTVAANGFAAIEITAGSLNLALTAASSSAAGDAVVFHFGGNTYIYGDSDANNLLDDTDLLVKVVGAVDLDLLVDTLG
jgi:hypothetical protein